MTKNRRRRLPIDAELPEKWGPPDPIWQSVPVPTLRRLDRVERWHIERDWERNWRGQAETHREDTA